MLQLQCVSMSLLIEVVHVWYEVSRLQVDDACVGKVIEECKVLSSV